MPQNAIATATIASQAFAAGTQAGGNYRFRAISSSGLTSTQLNAAPTATFAGLSTGTYSFTAARLGVDGTTVMGNTQTANGIVISADTIISIVTALAVNVVQATSS